MQVQCIFSFPILLVSHLSGAPGDVVEVGEGVDHEQHVHGRDEHEV